MSHPSQNWPQTSDTYKAYLIRMWQDGPRTGWRASAQSVQSGQVTHFANLAALFAFLQARATGIEDTVSADEKN